MDTSIQRALNDKLYDKRKIGALEYDASPSPGPAKLRSMSPMLM